MEDLPSSAHMLESLCPVSKEEQRTGHVTLCTQCRADADGPKQHLPKVHFDAT